MIDVAKKAGEHYSCILGGMTRLDVVAQQKCRRVVSDNAYDVGAIDRGVDSDKFQVSSKSALILVTLVLN